MGVFQQDSRLIHVRPGACAKSKYFSKTSYFYSTHDLTVHVPVGCPVETRPIYYSLSCIDLKNLIFDLS